jgi:DNA-binding NtrC family response regulator
MAGLERPRILMVDDDPVILDALSRQLHPQFDITTATSGNQALSLVMSRGPFAVVVSDLRMPGMDGVTLLYLIRQTAPDTVRILLTGGADVESAAMAVNDGNIFRLLLKPCPRGMLLRALEASIELYHANTAKHLAHP